MVLAILIWGSQLKAQANLSRYKPISLDELFKPINKYIAQEKSEMIFNDCYCWRTKETSDWQGKGRETRRSTIKGIRTTTIKRTNSLPSKFPNSCPQSNSKGRLPTIVQTLLRWPLEKETHNNSLSTTKILVILSKNAFKFKGTLKSSFAKDIWGNSFTTTLRSQHNI